MSAETIQISGSVFFKTPHTLSMYQEKTGNLLRRLQEIHPTFRKLIVLGEKGFLPLREDLSDLGERILTVVSAKGRADDLVFNTSDRTVGADTLNRIGFSVEFFSCEASAPDSLADVDRARVKLSVQGNSAGAEPNGGIVITIPPCVESSTSAPAELRRLVETTASVWELTVVGVRSSSFEVAIKQKGDLYSGQWMTYFRKPDLHSCLRTDISWRAAENGILVETTPHMPNAANPTDVAAGKRVREALDELGLVWHSTYAIHGWPPDEEEWRYEDFISGAPRGRKYRVRCIDFDGYDAARNVLLYAKLFRQLRQHRKEWGLRGWDGPVINEARRQVRAAHGTQIEWHIGLEEPAACVRTLLADHTDFGEDQLKIIYTPLSQALGS
jgi:hypothetical protein